MKKLNLLLIACVVSFVTFAQEDVPTLREVSEMPAGTATSAEGVVTFVSGNNVYIQDASGAILVQFAVTPAVNVGDRININAITVNLGSVTILTGASLNSAIASVFPYPSVIFLSVLESNRFRLVRIVGVRIESFASGTATITDGVTTVSAAVSTLPAGINIGDRINIIATVTYDGTTTALGAYPSNIELSAGAKVDDFVYPDIGDFSLSNRWIFSMNSRQGNNYFDNPIAPNDFARAMVLKDGIMYFSDRSLTRLQRVDIATGAMLTPINFAETGIFADVGGLPFNDLKLDANGNLVISSLANSAEANFQIWKLDIENPANSVKLLETTILTSGITTARVDYIGIWGSVDGDGYILAMNGSSQNQILRWNISGGVVDPIADIILMDITTPGTGITNLTVASAAQVIPISNQLFYLKHNNAQPTLLSIDDDVAIVVDGFAYYEGEEAILNPIAAPNGLMEFSLGGEYFLITSYNNRTQNPANTYRLFKFADAKKEFRTIEPMWVFPGYGFGGASIYSSSGQAIPFVEVDEAKGIATIALWSSSSGYAVYELTRVFIDNIEFPTLSEMVQLYPNPAQDFVYIKSDFSIEKIEIFNLSGTRILLEENPTDRIDLKDVVEGVYFARIYGNGDEVTTQKLLVR